MKRTANTTPPAVAAPLKVATVQAARPVELWRRGGARATMTREGGLLSIKCSGLLTLAAWAEIADAADGTAGNHAAVVVTDFTGAAIAIAEWELTGRGPARTVLSRRSLPGCVVVPESHIEMYRDWCWKLAQRGIEQASFTSRAEALTWAQGRLREIARYSHAAEPASSSEARRSGSTS